MDSKRAWVGYAVIRVLAFVVPFTLVMVAYPAWSFNWVAGVVAGTIIGVGVSYLFLRRHRLRMGADLAAIRERRDQRMQLDREEDSVLDAEEEPVETGQGRSETGQDQSSDVAGDAGEPDGPVDPKDPRSPDTPGDPDASDDR
ncbi:hypothetical protein GCM10011490_19620 [Pseudoclavibacter endophyticus]|uniref:DUF4229 domain-containing protein n=1 Tax=Pseudoclavibacter endophyticus TaxID=1778590 RepID=A0A6H9WN20_9MICO|nr:DUF4229 domain-containing protein [Pseudoclavibacter endophyticus]KAB1648026.1 DUF4229 domain-containing protein [Pseudoclavibacter endophyticus]GGA69129.1 hypothetical protein GCM10011490_19620 [Pseudoclavibacter endophyticus]